MTGNVRDNCYPHICFLPTHLHLASTDFIRFLLVATFADPHSHLLPIAVIVTCCYKLRFFCIAS